LASAAGSSGSTATATDQAKGKEPQFPPGVLVIKSTTSGNWTREPNDFNRVLDWVFESSPINVPQFGKGYRLQQFPLAKDPKESLQTLCELVREVNDVPPTFKTVVLNGLSFAPHSNGHLGKIPGLLCDAHVNSGAMPKVLGIITPPRNTNLYQRIANNGPQLTTIVCVTVGCQMAYALGQLLDAKKCHKDVRLINIHLGENHRATLGGYCSSAMNAVFARQTGAIKVQPSSSYDNVIHEAPELRPALVYTPAVHVYALGMVLYALASWSIPGRGMANKDIADLIQKGNGPMAFAPYPTDRDLIKLADIACKCCAFNPAQRPSIEQALKLLAELHHRLTTAVPSNTPASVSRGFYHAVRS
jgi:hypothetical protein